MPFKAGVVGKGFVGPAHAEALSRVGNVEVVALAGTDEARTREKAAVEGRRKAQAPRRE